MSVDFSDYLNEQLQDEDFRREYELAEFEYSLSQAIVKAREAEYKGWDDDAGFVEYTY